jgi:hypothetical protein
MIQTVGDLLRELAANEQQQIRKFLGIGHPGIIGDMYEGLARKMAERAIPASMSLRVVEGKAVNSRGEFSRQLDCMIVHGEGTQIPNTSHWIYPVQQVVALIEVKKTLYGSDLADGIDLFIDYWQRVAEPKAMPVNLLRDAWRGIVGSELPAKHEVSTLPPEQQIFFHTLMMEANLAPRIVLGFEGFKNEATLRQGLVDFIEKRISAGQPAPLGPLALPNLIIGRDASLLKLNGMPYAGPFDATNNRWSFYASRGRNAVDLLLEVIWTRLNYYHGVSSDIFGDDLEIEGVHPLLDGVVVATPQQQGWALHWTKRTQTELDAYESDVAGWNPHVVSNEAFVVLNDLCRNGEVAIDEELTRFLEKCGKSVDELARELNDVRLAYRDGDHFKLLTDECACVIDPVLGFVAAENKTGRLTRWVLKRIEERRAISRSNNGGMTP